MVDTFHYLGSENVYIEGKPYICIYVLSLNNKNLKKTYIHRIFKASSKDISELIEGLHVFDEITSFITFAIKSNGKVALDIIL